MKETIYTIPINEAFDTNCSCALCEIENRIEKEQIEYTLGPAMMEPDFRINSNKKGFCRHHYKSLLTSCKALPLALVLQTHIQQQNNDIYADKVEDKAKKQSLFKKASQEQISAQKMIETIDSAYKSCIICEKINSVMDRYLNNIIYIWKTENDFRQKFSSKEGFCLPHFSKLLSYALKELSQKDFNEFYHTLINMQQKSQNEMYDDISAFVRLFDHNSDKKATENVKNSIRRSIHQISGLNCEND